MESRANKKYYGGCGDRSRLGANRFSRLVATLLAVSLILTDAMTAGAVQPHGRLRSEALLDHRKIQPELFFQLGDFAALLWLN